VEVKVPSFSAKQAAGRTTSAWVKQELEKTGLNKKELLLCFLGVGTAAACV